MFSRVALNRRHRRCDGNPTPVPPADTGARHPASAFAGTADVVQLIAAVAVPTRSRKMDFYDDEGGSAFSRKDKIRKSR
jgi:hypothetical protein